MSGLYTDDWDNPVLERMGSELVPSSTSDVLEATAGSVLASNPTPRLMSASGDLIQQGIAVDDYGRPMDIGPPSSPTLQPDELNRRFTIKGSLSFDQPMTEAAAQGLYDSHRAEILRQDVIARGEGGLLGGAFGRGVTSLTMGVLDPINLAAAYVPGVGEARFGALLGDSTGATIAARAASGFTGGAAGMAALEPINVLLDNREHDDWSMSQALRDIAFGGLFGGGLHVIGGALGDALGSTPRPPVPNPITDRMEAAGFDARDMALRGAVAQLGDGRVVDVAPALDFVEARAAETELTQWADQQSRLTAEAEAAQDATRLPGAPDRTAEIGAASDHLAQLQEQADQFRTELGQAQAGTVQAAMDPATAERLGAVNAELAGVIPSARRIALERERTLLTEGRGTLDVPGAASDLEVARGRAQVTALQTGLDRVEQSARQAEADLASLRQQDSAAQLDAANAQVAADQASRVTLARVQSREAVTQAMAERTIRRFAGRLGVQLDPGEATAFARDVRTAAPGERADTIRHALGSIAARSPRPDIGAPTTAPIAAAPENTATSGQAPASPAAPTVTPSTGSTGLAGMGGGIASGISDGMHAMLWDRVQRGETTEAGQPSNLLIAAKVARDAGGLRTRAEYDAFARDIAPLLGDRSPGWQQRLRDAARRHGGGADAVGYPDVASAVRDQAAGLHTLGDAAAERLRQAAANAPGDFLDVSDRAANADAVMRAPKVSPEPAAQLAELQKSADTMAQAVETEIAAGRLSEADAAEMRQADQAMVRAEGDAKAMEAAAACIAGRMF